MAQTTSALWQELWAMANTKREYAFDVNGTWYGPEAEVEHKTDSALYEAFGIGNAFTGTLSLGLYADDIPRAAKIQRFMRLKNGDTVSEWLPKGVFYTNRRADDDGFWNVEAFDSMRKADVVWEPDQALVFPMTMPDAVAEFARLMGVEIDDRTELNSAYTIDYPANGYTIKDELRFIAAAHGANWIMSDAGKLRLVPLLPVATTHDVGRDVITTSDNGVYKPITRLTLTVDDENVITVGNDDGMELSASCPHATSDMAYDVFNTFTGYAYQAYSATAVNIDPAAELGDGATVEGVTFVIAHIEDDGYGYPSISAPGEVELEEEFPNDGPATQEINRKLAKARSEIRKTAEEISLIVEGINGELSKIETMVGSIRLSVSDPDANGYVSLSLIVGGVTQSLGLIKMEGNVDISGSVSAAALYAALGDIAQLTVDSLSTARKIPQYLAGNTEDLNFVDIREKRIALMRAWTDGSVVQATNPEGQALFWETDISEATLGNDGYPYIDGTRVFTVTYETDYPVKIYKYTEAVRWMQTFDDANNYGPIQQWGNGYGMEDPDRGKAFIRKLGGSIDMFLINSYGEMRGIFVGDLYTDITGLRRTTELDFTKWDSGEFTETLDGGIVVKRKVAFDAEGIPIQIKDEDGHEMTVKF